MTTLKQRLEEATAEAAAKKAAYGVAALAAVEDNGSNPKQLKEAHRVMQEAEDRVAHLQAAIAAGENRTMEQQAAEREATAAAERAAINAALAEVQRTGSAWDAALDALVSATQKLLDADNTLRRANPPADTFMQMERARSRTLLIIAYRLREWSGIGGVHPAFKEERLQPLLPSPVTND